MRARLYISLVQDPERFRGPDHSLAGRVLAMSQQNASQAELLRTLEADGWAIAHDTTTRDTIIFRADRQFDSTVAAINTARIAGATDHIIDCDDDGLEETLETSVPDSPVAVGQRYALTVHVERFPHFSAARGQTGTVTQADEHLVALTLDEPLPGAEEWDNAILFSREDAEPPFASAAEALAAVAVRLLPDA